MTGTVSKYFVVRAFGFIIPDSDFRSSVFFHLKNYNGATVPTEGMRVEYDMGPGLKPGETQAIKVIPALEKAVCGGAK